MFLAFKRSIKILCYFYSTFSQCNFEKCCSSSSDDSLANLNLRDFGSCRTTLSKDNTRYITTISMGFCRRNRRRNHQRAIVSTRCCRRSTNDRFAVVKSRHYSQGLRVSKVSFARFGRSVALK